MTLYVPSSCTWELTLGCTLRCSHCGSRAGRPRSGEMPRELMLRGLRELAGLGCTRVTLSGGEPTLSPHWEAMGSEGARLGMLMNMITNGLSPARELVQRARNAGLRNIAVSLDGLEHEHDRLRRCPGLFHRVMELIGEAGAQRFPISVITTITRRNLRELDAMHALLVGKCCGWQLQIGAAMGALRDHRTEQLAPEQLLEVIPSIARLIERGGVALRVGDNVGYFGPFERTLRRARAGRPDHWTGCQAGCAHIGIESDGNVKGCLSMQTTVASEGNVGASSLVDIWHRRDGFAYNRAFQLDDLGGFCRTCEYATVCRGGCASMRTCHGGTDNPYCYHRVATLAERARKVGRRAYVPMALAPAALLAVLGAGCGGEAVSTDSGPARSSTDASAKDAPLDGPRDVHQGDMVPFYGDSGPPPDAPEDALPADGDCEGCGDASGDALDAPEEDVADASGE